ncbi:MAG: relaxase/mobilization nuclease domain-containing protein [Phocaeicola vulgatus]|jgi:hypothetical protein|nr:relaxase/mobilization nuclease domain-containing protein [Phocaeicola vulgatus]
MIAKIKSGKGFGGLVNYANDIKDKNTKILHAYGVSTTSNATVIASFKCQSQGCKSDRYVGHLMLAFSPKDTDKLNDNRMVEIAQEYMKRMNITDTQYVIYRHYDKAHPHLHIVYNRVNNKKKLIKGDQNFRKSALVTKQLTKEYGLTFGSNKQAVKRDRLYGKDKIKYHIYDTTRSVLPSAKSFEDLKQKLALNGIKFNFTRGNDGFENGIVFSASDISFPGCKIDKTMTYEELNSFFEMQPKNTKQDTGNDIIGIVTELALQPHIAHNIGTGAGGNNNDTGWGEDDKNRYKPKRRR